MSLAPNFIFPKSSVNNPITRSIKPLMNLTEFSIESFKDFFKVLYTFIIVSLKKMLSINLTNAENPSLIVSNNSPTFLYRDIADSEVSTLPKNLKIVLMPLKIVARFFVRKSVTIP